MAYRKGKTLDHAQKDKMIVTLLNTCKEAGLIPVGRGIRGGELVNIRKPKIVIDYTKNMRGVNQTDQYAAIYCFFFSENP